MLFRSSGWSPPGGVSVAPKCALPGHSFDYTRPIATLVPQQATLHPSSSCRYCGFEGPKLVRTPDTNYLHMAANFRLTDLPSHPRCGLSEDCPRGAPVPHRSLRAIRCGSPSSALAATARKPRCSSRPSRSAPCAWVTRWTRSPVSARAGPFGWTVRDGNQQSLSLRPALPATELLGCPSLASSGAERASTHWNFAYEPRAAVGLKDPDMLEQKDTLQPSGHSGTRMGQLDLETANDMAKSARCKILCLTFPGCTRRVAWVRPFFPLVPVSRLHGAEAADCCVMRSQLPVSALGGECRGAAALLPHLPGQPAVHRREIDEASYGCSTRAVRVRLVEGGDVGPKPRHTPFTHSLS